MKCKHCGEEFSPVQPDRDDEDFDMAESLAVRLVRLVEAKNWMEAISGCAHLVNVIVGRVRMIEWRKP